MRMPKVRRFRNPSGQWAYFIDYKDRNGERQRPVIGPRKADAERAAAAVYNQMMDGKIGVLNDPAPSISLQTLIDSFMLSKKHRIKKLSLERYDIHARNLITFYRKHFRKVKTIDQIKRNQLEEFMEDSAHRGIKNSTINRQIQFVRMLFNYAIEEDYLKENPAAKLKRYQEQHDKPIQFWTKEEVKLILDSLPDHWRPHFEFLYLTGLRKGELINLTWDDVELNQKNCVVKIQAKDDWRPKVNQIRSVPLNKQAIAIIKKLQKQGRGKYVFTGLHGGKVHHDKIYTNLKSTLRKLGLEGNVHQFRHTFASHLLMSGVSTEALSKLLGHSSIEMTQKYAHVSEDHLQAGVERLKL